MRRGLLPSLVVALGCSAEQPGAPAPAPAHSPPASRDSPDLAAARSAPGTDSPLAPAPAVPSPPDPKTSTPPSPAPAPPAAQPDPAPKDTPAGSLPRPPIDPDLAPEPAPKDTSAASPPPVLTDPDLASRPAPKNTSAASPPPAPTDPGRPSEPAPKDTPAVPPPRTPTDRSPRSGSPPHDIALASSPAPKATSPRAPLELAFVGDIILGKYVLHGYASLVDDGGDPFARVRRLTDADLLVGNLETPLVRERPSRSPLHIGYRFGADADAARALVRAGLGALSLANNHANDLLGDGLRDTPEILRELGIAGVGAARATGDPVVVVTIERGGWRIGLVSATTYVNRGTTATDPALPLYRTRELPPRLLPHLAAARADHDLLLVLVHWGQEFADAPDHFQRTTARRLLDGGADLVIGHHPHVLQGVERHDHGLVAYSLGNFLFANFDERSRRSGVLRVRYEPGRRCPTAASFHPVWLGPAPTYTPEPAAGPVAAEILAQVRKASRRLGTPWTAGDDRLLLTEFPACDPPS